MKVKVDLGYVLFLTVTEVFSLTSINALYVMKLNNARPPPHVTP